MTDYWARCCHCIVACLSAVNVGFHLFVIAKATFGKVPVITETQPALILTVASAVRGRA
jgi:hypothetical protein